MFPSHYTSESFPPRSSNYDSQRGQFDSKPSSALYNFAPAQPTLDQDDIYRSISVSAPMFHVPTPPHKSASLSFEDFDAAFARQFKVELQYSYQISKEVRKDLSTSAIGSVASLASISDLASLESPAPVAAQLTVPPAEYIEPYTSFYSRARPQVLMDCISSFLTSLSIDFEFHNDKSKFIISFLCPVFSALSISFNIRLFSSPHDRDSIICEAQRRQGCVMGFNCLWSRIVNHIKQLGLIQKEFEQIPFPSQAPEVNRDLHHIASVTRDLPSLSLQLDDQSFELLRSLVTEGSAEQQCDALRLLCQGMAQLESSSSSQHLPALIKLVRVCLQEAQNSRHGFYDEKAAQVTRLVARLLDAPDQHTLHRSAALELVPALIGLLAVVLSELTLTRIKIVRFIIGILSSLTSDRDCAQSIKQSLDANDLSVLDRCCTLKDQEVARLALTISQRLIDC